MDKITVLLIGVTAGIMVVVSVTSFIEILQQHELREKACKEHNGVLTKNTTHPFIICKDLSVWEHKENYLEEVKK